MHRYGDKTRSARLTSRGAPCNHWWLVSSIGRSVLGFRRGRMVRGISIWCSVSSCNGLRGRGRATRRGSLPKLLGAALLLWGAAPAAVAQGAVSGVVTLDERPGADRGD